MCVDFGFTIRLCRYNNVGVRQGQVAHDRQPIFDELANVPDACKDRHEAFTKPVAFSIGCHLSLITLRKQVFIVHPLSHET